jgi:RHH-type proline utilization regulon transcriptional repressor/proline dehydrogenase/delta 1-pyrroline-5-carboxylate dehydrogenase
LRVRIAAHYRRDETEVLAELLDAAQLPRDSLERISATARELVTEVRKRRIGKGGIDAFMHEYELSSQEGVVLMCLAEALLRVPDASTADRLIRDKLGSADWEKHLGHSQSLFVNASTWALMLTGRFVGLQEYAGQDPKALLGRLAGRIGEPVVRQAITQAMRILGRQFVMGRTIDDALARARAKEALGYRYSYDMLGEAAHTAEDAARYLAAYEQAITAIASREYSQPADRPELSVKLSALHPRFEYSHRGRVRDELIPRVRSLAAMAKEADLGMTLDAEEAERLDLLLDVVDAIANDLSLAGWQRFGCAVQTYQKRAAPVIDWLAELAKRSGRRLSLRLVKGAYWDTEVKRAQERGLDGYPVFTRKVATDVAYLACARQVLHYGEVFFPQFATHNAHTLAAVSEMAGGRRDFEFQCLHGMGEVLYEQVVQGERWDYPCRIYAPVGSHEDLLPYLVRRLLENGANSSFINRIVDEREPVDLVIADPLAKARALPVTPHPRIPLPRNLYGRERVNAKGVDVTDPLALAALAEAMAKASTRKWTAAPLVGGVVQPGTERPLLDPADRRREVGRVIAADEAAIDKAMGRAARAVAAWNQTPAGERADILVRAAELLEDRLAEFMCLAVREAGKTLPDALAEVREAVDFCRYYACCCRHDFSQPREMPGPTGEHNQLTWHGRGVFVCISPWNFPLAIFVGQVAAALAAGDAVLAKPAEQTPLIAAQAVVLLHEAGVPADVLHLLPGDGPGVGARLVADPKVAGVAFTGATATARAINRALAAKAGPMVQLIAETGGQNAMIVDSSALPEQVITDVLASAFQSAGQRCSALRVLFIQRDIAPKLTDLLAGAMAELTLGDPGLLQTDVGPVIDAGAKAMLERHAARMRRDGRLIYACPLPATCNQGDFFPPHAFEIDDLAQLDGEVFGPILHVIRYDAGRLDEVIDAINATGYGLTFGVHSRIDETVAYIQQRLTVGNAYVNRNMIGAVVGVQPFGGEGLSGTGPKAGGPHYLHRFATERTLSVNLTAQGGNASLLSLHDE